MRAALLAIAATALLASAARADKNRDETATDEELVLVNANPRLGNLGQLTRIKRVLEQHNMLRKLPDALEKTLEGRDVALDDVEQIREAFLANNFDAALKLVDEDEHRVLENVVAGDPIPALSELAQWRGLIAASLDQKDEAVTWFRVALRFNPAWTVDKRYASSAVRALVKKAHREVEQHGYLRFDIDPDGASAAVDGEPAKPATGKVELPAGKHLLVVTAPEHKPYAELVDIEPDRTNHFTYHMDVERKADRAARLVDETVSAPAGKQRLKKTRALSKLTGVSRALVIEDGTDDRVVVRLYDTELKKVSKPIEIEGSASSAAIARKIKAALDPDTLVDAEAIAIATSGRSPRHKWYEQWYVWVAVGAVAAIGGVAGYEYATRAPTTVRGF